MKKLILSSFLFLCACSSDAFITTHGSLPPQSKIEQLEIGDSKQMVLNTLGSPSNVSSLDSNTWIYMASTSKKIAFLEPELISRDIVVVEFGANNTIKSISKKDELSGKEVVVATEETSIKGAEKDKNFFEKAFGKLNPNLAQ